MQGTKRRGGKRLRWILKLLLLLCMSGGFFTAAVYAKNKKAEKRKAFWKHIKQFECYKARNLSYSLTGSRNKKDNKRYFLALARCFRSQRSYTYYAQRFYQKTLMSKPTRKEKLEAKLFMLSYRVRYVYYYNSSYYRKRRDAFRKSLEQMRKELSKAGVGPHSQWMGEYEMIEMKFHTKIREYGTAYAQARQIWRGRYPKKIRAEALLYAGQSIVYHYRGVGMPTDPSARRRKIYKKVFKKYRGTPAWAHATYLLGQEVIRKAKTFDKGLRYLRAGARYPKTYWGKRCASALEAAIQPMIRPMFPMRIEPKKQHKLSFTFMRIRKATLRLYKSSIASVFAAKHNLFDLSNVKLDKSNIVLRRVVKLPAKQKITWENRSQQINKEVSLSIAPGAYILEIEGKNKYKRRSKVRVPVFITHHQMIVKQARKRLIVAVVDSRNNQPVPHAKVILGLGRKSYKVNNRYFYKTKRIVTGKADKEGIFRYTFKKEKQSRIVQLMGCRGKECSYAQTGRNYNRYRYYGHYRWYYRSWYAYRRLQHKLFWSTDRGAYRPGQQVFFKGIYHRQQFHKWQDVRKQRVRVRVQTPKGKKLFKKVFTLDALGTFAGDFSIPKSAPLGKYTALVEVLYKKRTYAQRTFYKHFRVEEYRRPKFVVSAALQPGIFRHGDTLKWKVSAQYTFGGAVKFGKVKWKLEREATYPEFSFPRPFAWYFKKQVQRPYWYRRYYRYRYRSGNKRYWMKYYKRLMKRYRGYMQRYPNRSYYKRYYERYRKQYLQYIELSKPLAKGTGRLDKNGVLKISTKTPLLKSGKYGYFKYHLKVEVTDSSRRMIPGTGSTVVGHTPALAYMRTTKEIVLPGEKVKVLLRTLRPDGKGVPVKGQLYIIKGSKKGKPQDIAEQKMNASTDANGRGVIKFVADYLGYFRLVFVGKLSNGKTIQTSTTVWLGSDKLKHTDYPYKQLEVVADKDLYKIGERASILINTPKVPKAFLVTVEGEGLFWSSMVTPKGRSTVTTLPVLRTYTPNAWVTVTYLFKGKMLTASRRIIVPPTDKFLNVKIVNLKKTYKPGEKVTWKLKVTDNKGRPVSSELLLFAYDKSLDLIGKVDFPDIRKAFYDRQQKKSTITTTSALSMKGYQYRLNYQVTKEKLAKATGSAFGVGGIGTRGGGGARPPAPAAEAVAPAKSAPLRRSRAKRRLGDSSKDADDMARKPVAVQGQKRDKGGLAKSRKRTDFRETAVWLAKLRTNRAGEATARFTWPDSLTTWSVRTVVIGKGVRVAAVQKETQTRKKLMLQIAAPRFFMVGDKAKVALLAYNRSKKQRVRVKLRVKGLKILGRKQVRATLAAGADKRFVFEVKALQAGKVKLWAEIASSEAADSVEVKREIHAFGLDRHEAFAGTMFKKGKRTMPIKLPKVFSKGSSHLELNVNSSLTRSVFDSLGYLVKFPYGCVEQTMSRFLPAALVAKTLTGLDKAEPKLAKKLPKVIDAGLQRLYNFQHSDGGWGWWQYDSTNDFMTAYVLFGLSVAQNAGYKIDKSVLSRGTAYLKGKIKSLRKKPALHAYAMYALSLRGILPKPEIDHSLAKIKKLNAYSLALLTLAFQKHGDKASTQYLLKRLHTRLKSARAGDEAFFGGRGTMRGWSEDGIEATAVGLRALIKAKAYKKDWPRIARWLLRNRRGRRWKSTRDTAQAILALSSFAVATGEGRGQRKIQLLVDGRVVGTYTLNPQDPKRGGFRYMMDDAMLRSGKKRITIRSLSNGPVYYGMRLQYRTLETRIPAGGSGILSIKREFFRVIERNGKTQYRKIRSGQAVKAGSDVEVRITFKSKNQLKYLLFKDNKPAGLEPVQIKSGAPTISWVSHQEFRDTHVAIFAGLIQPSKVYKLKYRMKAERPGRYRTLPTIGGPMYVPAAGGHSRSFMFVIKP
ncbi:MAG TPA: hypothetical protein DCE42_25040 [Myxococcales bacterium]|nr:hypothetical protein [Deltaproteobacteria bacterium]HAA58052.1 hypothetical protein [Myxococcales bacterium]